MIKDKVTITFISLLIASISYAQDTWELEFNPDWHYIYRRHFIDSNNWVDSMFVNYRHGEKVELGSVTQYLQSGDSIYIILDNNKYLYTSKDSSLNNHCIVFPMLYTSATHPVYLSYKIEIKYDDYLNKTLYYYYPTNENCEYFAIKYEYFALDPVDLKIIKCRFEDIGEGFLIQ